jgi:hypothetical protein
MNGVDCCLTHETHEFEHLLIIRLRHDIYTYHYRIKQAGIAYIS